jgi:YfiH family protein
MIRWEGSGRYTVVFSTRVGGVSDGPYESLNLGVLTGDDPGRVVENRRLLSEHVGIDPERTRMAWQQHGAEVRRATPEGILMPGTQHEACDGWWSDEPGQGMMLVTADCLPVAIARENGDRPALAVLHVGWRGLLDGIVENGAAALGDGALSAVIGPGIGPCCYEVGADVAGPFAARFGAEVATDGKVDLWRATELALNEAGCAGVERTDLCTFCHPELFFSHRRDRDEVRERYERIRSEVGPGVTVVVATKYVTPEDLAVLAEAGVEVLGENRAQDLEAKHERHGGAFRWHFIGHLQSRKAKTVNALCELVHSLDSESAAQRLEVPALVQVNLAGEESKSGVAPAQLEEFLANAPVDIRGLSTMPPLAEDPEESRPYFRTLRELAERMGLKELSMGTSQDYRVAAEEGATYVRVGSALYGTRSR